MRPVKESNKSRLASLTDSVKSAVSGSGSAAPSKPTLVKKTATPILNKRAESANATATPTSGKARHIKVFKHDPARIRPWSGHNRDYGALSKERCKDLIDGFRRVGQQFPAIVRKVNSDASNEFDYEFICGARRHWTASFLPDTDLLIEVRDLSDKDAFLLQDIENREREDVSDYERAVDYTKGLHEYYGGKKIDMANHLNQDPGNFNRLLALADLPKEIVKAYADIRELLTHHGTAYHAILKNPDSKAALIAAAKQIRGKKLNGKEVFKLLKNSVSSTDSKPSKKKSKSFKQGALTIKQSAGGVYSVDFKVPAKDKMKALQEIRRDFSLVVEQLLENQNT